MEFLAMLYTVLLVAICLMMALLLFRSGRPTGGLDEADCEELKDWLEEQLAAQAREFNARQDAIAQQNYAAIRSVSETLHNIHIVALGLSADINDDLCVMLS